MKKLVLFLLLPIALKAQTNYPILLDNYMQAQAKVNQYSGTVIVVKKNQIVYEKVFGKADKEWNVENTVDTKKNIII